MKRLLFLILSNLNLFSQNTVNWENPEAFAINKEKNAHITSLSLLTNIDFKTKNTNTNIIIQFS
jgi:hypothetical protein